MSMELVKYNKNEAAIADLRTKYMDMVILPGDEAAFKMAWAGIKECNALLDEVDDWHKERKADILVAGRYYDSEKNNFHAEIDPIKKHLQDIRKAEEARAKAVDAERIARIQARITLISDNSNIEYDTPSDKLQQRITTLETIVIDDSYEEFAFEAETKKESALMVLNIALTKRLQFEKEEADRAADKLQAEKDVAEAARRIKT
jgi:hypothetical protein